MPFKNGENLSLLGVRLRLFKPVFFPEGQSVSVSVLNQDGSIAKYVSSFPDEVEMQANLDFIIPIQVFCGSKTSCTTLFVPLAEVMKHCGNMPVFCTLWLGVPTANESCKDYVHDGNAYAIEQHFERMLNLGKDLTHPKLGVGVRLTDALSNAATPREHFGLFRVVDMYEDLLAHVYTKTSDHLMRLGNESFDMEFKQDARSPSNVGSDATSRTREARSPSPQRQPKQDSDPSKERLQQLLAHKQKKITQLQTEVHKLKMNSSRESKDRPIAACKDMYDKAMRDQKTALGSRPVIEASSNCAELEEMRSKCEMLELELQNTQEAAKNQMDLQTRRFVQSMREVQTKATDYEEEMKRREVEVAELRSELDQANLEADEFRDMCDSQKEAHEKEFEEEMRRRDHQHELLVNELRLVREELEAQKRLSKSSMVTKDGTRAETDAESLRFATSLGSNGRTSAGAASASRHRAVTAKAFAEQDSRTPTRTSRLETTPPVPVVNSKSKAETDLEEQAVFTVTFQPGDTGVIFESGVIDNGMIQAVKKGGMADRAGVKGGLQMLSVGGRPYTADRFIAAANGKNSYQVVFSKAPHMPVNAPQRRVTASPSEGYSL